MMIVSAVPAQKRGYLPTLSLRRPMKGRHEVDRRQLCEGDAEVVDGECAAERHQHEAARCQQGRRREGLQIAALRDGAKKVQEGVPLALQLEVGVDWLKAREDDAARDDRQRDDHEERRMPPPAVRQIEAERQAEYLAGGERGLHDAHDPATHVERKEIGDDGHRDRADDAAEDPGDDARGQQELVGRREAAEERAPGEAGVEEEEELLAIEAVGEPSGEQARERSAEGIHRHDQAELLGREVQIAQQDRAERRDDHEIEDDRELQEREHADHELLVRGEGGRRTCVRALAEPRCSHRSGGISGESRR